MRKHKNKFARRISTSQGFQIKVWKNVKTGVILPTHWKQQAGYLSKSKLDMPVEK